MRSLDAIYEYIRMSSVNSEPGVEAPPRVQSHRLLWFLRLVELKQKQTLKFYTSGVSLQ